MASGHPPPLPRHDGVLDVVEEFSLRSGTWRSLPGTKAARYYHAAAADPLGNVFVAGGFGSRVGVGGAAVGAHPRGQRRQNPRGRTTQKSKAEEQSRRASQKNNAEESEAE